MDQLLKEFDPIVRSTEAPWLDAPISSCRAKSDDLHWGSSPSCRSPGVEVRASEGDQQGRVLYARLLGWIDLGKSLTIRVTQNRQSIVTVRRSAAGYRVRLHGVFAHADEEVIRALGNYITRNDHEAAQTLGRFIETNRDLITSIPPRARSARLRTEGRHHDLQGIYDDLNRTYFDAALDVCITWGPNNGRKPRKSIKVGSYSVEDRLIRIHPALDSVDVPSFFVAWVVYHEMLHAKHPITQEGARRCFHSPAFLAEEKLFAGHAEAERWQALNLDRLLDA